MDGQDFIICLPTVDPHPPGSAHARAPRHRTQVLSVPGKCYWSRVLRKWRHLMLGTTGHDNSLPHAPDSKYLSTGIHPGVA
jgi:hypothetical protein